jgi:phosphatidylinositol alpha-1,6-mannosyltransferase
MDSGEERPLRILFLDSWHPAPHEGSGTAVGISSLHRGLVRLGHDVDVLRPEGSPDAPGSRLHFNLDLPRRIRDRPLPPDLVVGFDVDGVRWARSRPPDSRYVVSLKGVAADEARFSRSPEEKRHLSTLARFEQRNAAAGDAVLVPSRYSADVVQRAYRIPRARIRVVPEPIDLESWDSLHRSHSTSRSTPPSEGPLTILSVARQYPRKDTATLLRAMPAVRSALPGTRLRIVGGGPELPNLRKLAGTLDLSDTVTFDGSVPDDAEVRRRYFESHLFCLPSLQEGFGIVFLEAMAAGLPIVAVHAGSVPEVVPHGVAGLLVPPGDEGRLAAALVELLRDRDRRIRMGREGRTHVRRFDLPTVSRVFLKAAMNPSTVAPSLSTEAS